MDDWKFVLCLVVGLKEILSWGGWGYVVRLSEKFCHVKIIFGSEIWTFVMGYGASLF